jgi:hypothetical protein
VIDEIDYKIRCENLHACLFTIEKKFRVLLYLRFFEGETLAKIADYFGNSPERIRQMEAKTLRKFRNASRAKFIDRNWDPKLKLEDLRLNLEQESWEFVNDYKLNQEKELILQNKINAENAIRVKAKRKFLDKQEERRKKERDIRKLQMQQEQERRRKQYEEEEKIFKIKMDELYRIQREETEQRYERIQKSHENWQLQPSQSENVQNRSYKWDSIKKVRIYE